MCEFDHLLGSSKFPQRSRSAGYFPHYLVPHYPRSRKVVPVTNIVDSGDLENLGDGDDDKDVADGEDDEF
jgi:hypothetical protein